MYFGILAGLTTCALWGLTFVAPRAVLPFSAFDIAAGRYGFFGLFCVLMMLHPRFRPVGKPASLWLRGIILGSIGYVGYFLCASFAVRQAGAVIPPLIMGLMPVLLPIIANRRENTVPWYVLAVPLAMIAAGLAVANANALAHSQVGEASSVISGALWATAALAIWIGYCIGNAAVLRRPDAPSGLHWTGMQGVGAGFASLLLLPFLSYGTFATASGPETTNFFVWAITMALACSWVATWCWVLASRRLPLALSSQLIIAETLFGLAFGLMFERRLPDIPETIGAALQMGGVCMAVYAFGRSAKRSIAH